jgi:hypothetical protein
MRPGIGRVFVAVGHCFGVQVFCHVFGVRADSVSPVELIDMAFLQKRLLTEDTNRKTATNRLSNS